MEPVHGKGSNALDADATADEMPADSQGVRANQALYFYGIARTRTWRGGRITTADGGVQRVRYRDVEALVASASYDLPPFDDEHLLAHQRVLEAAMHRGTVLPAPYGIVFRGRRQLIHMMQDQYVAIDEGLSFLDGYWELRVHISAPTVAETAPELADAAMHIYSEMRRHARAAVPFPSDRRRLVSAAFLVERNGWIEFIEHADDLGAAHPDLSFDVTGPWPAYDFVHISP